ncbi:MAG: IclR family transcriptional regulator [Thermoleophilia bacterium]|nr:IclR family transcriptional regulator [Thermoleophilia bacterium]
MPGPRVLTSALRCLALLERVAESSTSVGVSELARELGVGRGTVHQQLSTLVAAGWVEQMDGGRYRLTLRATRLGYHALEQANLGQRIRPSLEALAAATSLAVSLAVLDDGEALIVQRVESGQILRIGLGVGVRMPLVTSASGRVLVAFSPDEQVAALRERGVPLPAADIIERIRREGVAISKDEYLEDIVAVAAPVFDMAGHLLAALSVAGLSSKFEEEPTVTHVHAAAAEVNGILGGHWPGLPKASSPVRTGLADQLSMG